MVAIVSGNSLGLNLTSGSVLGAQGTYGDPRTGQGGEQVYVNASTGNLVMQQLQDQLVASGLDVTSVLTYNSLGLANDDNGDNFSIGKVPAQLVLSGTVNTAGSTLTRTAFDGSQTVYTWDAANSRYVAVNGTGAFDTITYAASKYTWVDGATQQLETYDGTTARLLTRADAAGNTLMFGYDGTTGMLTSVTDANGETVTYVYSGTLLTQINAPVTTWVGGVATTSVQPVVKYGYDTSNRLSTVTVDLTPDGSTIDGKVYTTSFNYDGTSKRVHMMSQSDGTQLTFVYDGSNRVYTITDALNNVTQFTYDTVNLKTSVLAGGQTTVYAYNASGQLLSVTAPAVNGVSPVTQYAYNASGEVVTATDADGRITSMAYDAAGNQVSVLDGAGNLTTRVYDAKNRLLTETTATAPVPALVATAGMTVSGGTAAKSGATSAWDSSVRSAASVSGAAAVSFTATSVATHVMVALNSDPDTDANYPSLDYALYLNAGGLAVYSNGTLVVNPIGSYVAGDRLSVSYDGNGHVNFVKNGQVLYTMASTPTQPLYLDTSFKDQGTSVTNLTFGTGAPADLTTRYVYSADGKGLLRYKITPDGRVTEYGYNTQGQLTSSNEYVKTTYSTTGLAPGVAPTEAAMNTWRGTQDLTQTQRTDIARDSRQQITSTTSYSSTAADGTGVAVNALATTYVYDPSGRLLQTVKPGIAKSTFAYDGLGRLTSTTDPLGRTTGTAYTDATNTVAVTYANQLVTTSVFDKDGRLISMTSASSGTTLAKNTVDYDSLGHVLRSTDLTGASTWYLYDADGRKVAAVDGNGALTQYVYDNASQVTETIAYATPVNLALFVDGTGKPINPALSTVVPAFNPTTDHRSWTVYDLAGRVSQHIDAKGAVTQFNYDGDDRVTSTCTFATTVDVTAFGSAPAFQVVTTTTGDRVARNFYDGDGDLVGSLDPDNFLTVYGYDAAGQRASALRYATASPAALAQSTLSQLIPATDPGDQRTVTLYDMMGRVTGQIDALGYLTQTVYNAKGTIDHATRYATSVGTSVAAGTAVDSLTTAAGAALSTTSYLYDGDDRLASKTDPTGIVTTYSYDPNTDALVSSTTGSGRADATTTQSRYDAMGRVVAQLDGVGSALITVGMTQTQIDAVWAQHAVTTTYDLAGRRTGMVDALGNRTLYFYDGDGQLRYTVDPLNNVKELRYNAFGNVSMTIAYATPINPAAIGAGGLVTSGLTSAVAAAANTAKDLVTRQVYDGVGNLALAVDASGVATAYTYDAFGNVTQQRQYANTVPTGGALKVNYVASTNSAAASLLLGSFNVGDVVTATVRFKSTPAADGHAIVGRLYVGTFGGNGTASPATQVTGLWQTLTVSYTVTATNTPIYVYVYGNRDGQPVAGDSVQYDNLRVTSVQQGVVMDDSIDTVVTGTGRDQWIFSGSSQQVFNSLADAGTDAQLQALVATLADASRDRVTRTVRDADGRATLVVDPTGTATQYTYDASGNVTQVRQLATPVPAGGAVRVNYVYNTNSSTGVGLGNFAVGDVVTATVRFRATPSLTHAIVGRVWVGGGGTGAYSPATPATGGWQTITTTFTVTTAGTVSLNLYGNRDGAPQAGDYVDYDNLVVTSQQKGAVLSTSFDPVNFGPNVGQWASDGVNQFQVYSTPADAGTDAQLLAYVNGSIDDAHDRITRTVFDADGRATLTVDPTGAATSYAYDANGNLVQTRQYANKVPAGGALQVNYVATVNPAAQRLLGTFNQGDVVTASVWVHTAGTQTGMIKLKDTTNTGESLSAPVASADGWSLLTVTYVVPTNNTSLWIYLYGNLTAKQPSDAVLYDNLSVTSASKGVVYADSFDTVQVGDGTSGWLGIANGAGGQAWVTAATAGSDVALNGMLGGLRDDAHDRVTRTVYDADGRETLSVDATGAATSYAYDANGNVVQTRQYVNKVPAGGALQATYWSAGNPVAQRSLGTFNQGDVVTASVWVHTAGVQAGMLKLKNTTINAESASAQTASVDGWTQLTVTYVIPANNTSLWVYLYGNLSSKQPTDAVLYDNLTVSSVSKGNVYSDNFDAVQTGNGLGSWAFAGNAGGQAWVTPATAGSDTALTSLVGVLHDDARDRTINTEYNADGQPVWSSDSLGQVTRTIYDAMGRPIYVIAPDGAVSRNDYDADGRVARTTTFANKLTTANFNSLPHSPTATQLAAMLVASPANDAVLARQFNAFGQVRFSMDGTGAVSEMRYDAGGNVVDSIAYATKIDPTTWNATTPPTVVIDVVHDRHVHSRYDAFGNVLAQADGTGAVVINTYDADGRLTDRVSYANRIVAGSWTTSALPVVVADATRDIHERFSYDNLGRLTYSADGTGAVTAYVYDADNRVTQKTLLATLAPPGQALNTVASNVADRTERFNYDAFGRQTWHIDATGALDYTAYDPDGRVAQTIRYAQTTTTLPTTMASLPTSSSDRVSSVYYNAFGQVTYSIDALNRVSLNIYDAVGRLSTTTRYAGAIAAGVVPSTVTVPVDAINDQSTNYQYDGAGRVKQRTDAMGGVQSYTYDGAGNMLTLTDEKNQVWSWTYDADGHQLTQTAPSVYVTTNSVNGSGDLAATPSNVSIVTAMVYDGTGNLTQRTEAYGRSDARTTVFGYDAAERMVSAQGPAFNTYDYQGNLVSSAAPVSSTFYDAFGNVVSSVDAAGNTTYTTYDQANRVAFSVDQLGYVTGNARNAFGDVLAQTRYGAQTTLIGAAPTSAANAPMTTAVASVVGASDHTSDRVTSFSYDAVGRVASQSGMGGYFLDATAGFSSNAMETAATPTTSYQYDAFGDLILKQQLVNQAQGLYASTYHYFDQVGQETDTVDAMGYQTHRTFDKFGNVTQTIEYASAKTGSWSVGNLGATPTASTNDRTTSDVFDRLNRKTSETRTVSYSLTDDGNVSGSTLTTSWGYDAEGNVTRTTDASGASAYCEYDALGQLRAVIAPTRSSTTSGSAITPVTEYGYDAFGDVTTTSQRANSATSVSEFIGVWTSGGGNGYAVSASGGDRITRALYDNGGHAVQVDDPLAGTSAYHNTWNYYDADGRLVYSKHYDAGNNGVQYTVDQGEQYDAKGQRTAVSQSVGTASAPREAVTGYRYNAFGEVVATGVDNGWQAFFDYDNNGNLWLTNTGNGVVTAYANDLQGQVSAEYVSQGVGHGDVDLSTATSIQSVVSQAANLRVTNSVHDLKGNVVRIDEATRSTTDAGVNVRVGSTTWSITHSGTTGVANTLTLNFNSLLALGNGQVQFTINYTATDGTASTVTLVADSAQAASSYAASWTPASHPGITSVTSVTIAKADVDGVWHTVNTSTSSGVSHTQLEIDTPDNPRSVVTFTYTKSGGSPVTLTATNGLINYGSEYSFDTSALAAGTYNYSTTITSPDGTVTAPRIGTFVVGTTQTASLQTTQITPSVFQTFDRWGNLLSVTDPSSASWVTTFQYNGNNQVVKMTQPAPLTGSAVPVTQYFYDRQGHRVATVDADNHLSGQLFDTAGQLAETDGHPDGSTLVKTTNAYDIFGELVQSVAGDGYTSTGTATSSIANYTTFNTFDALGNLLSVQHGTGTGNVSDVVAGVSTAVNERQGYTYDADGQRLSSWDDTTSTHFVTTYAYDAAGHLVATTLPLVTGQSTASSTTYSYDSAGHETSETDANGNMETWTYDYFGRVTAHKGLGTTTYAYTYDHAGQLYHQTNTAGQNLTYSFDAAGEQTGIYDSALNETTSYTYDAAGRHLEESVALAGVYYQDNHLAYDNVGRLVDSADDQTHVSYQYDAVGNRTYIGIHVLETGSLLGPSATSPTDSTRYFTYDGMNRQLDVNWQSQTVQGQQGHVLTYDADGNRLSDTFYNNLLTITGTLTQAGTAPDGKPIYTGFVAQQTYSVVGGTVTEAYSYDADDRLTQALYSIVDGNDTTPGWILIDGRSYDTAGHMMTRGANLPRPAPLSSAPSLLSVLNESNASLPGLNLDTDRVDSFTYDQDGQMLTETISGSGSYSISYTYDAAGNSTGNTLTTLGSDTTTTVVDVVTNTPAQGYQATNNTSTQTVSDSGGTTTTMASVTNHTTYDANGYATAVTTTTSNGTTTTKAYSFVNDEQGNVLRRTNASGVAQMRNLVVNGESIGQYGYDDSGKVATQQENLSFGFKSMIATDVQSGSTTLTAVEGETLQQVATAAYGDARLWRRIAAANGLSDSARLQAGQQIIIASGPGQSYNGGATFAVNDQAAMTSELAPQIVVNAGGMSDSEQHDYSTSAVRPSIAPVIPPLIASMPDLSAPMGTYFGMDLISNVGTASTGWGEAPPIDRRLRYRSSGNDANANGQSYSVSAGGRSVDVYSNGTLTAHVDFTPDSGITVNNDGTLNFGAPSVGNVGGDEQESARFASAAIQALTPSGAGAQGIEVQATNYNDPIPAEEELPLPKTMDGGFIGANGQILHPSVSIAVQVLPEVVGPSMAPSDGQAASTLVGYHDNQSTQPIYSAGSSNPVGAMRPTSDTSGLYFDPNQVPYGANNLQAYVDDAGNKAWGADVNGQTQFFIHSPPSDDSNVVAEGAALVLAGELRSGVVPLAVVAGSTLVLAAAIQSLKGSGGESSNAASGGFQSLTDEETQRFGAPVINLPLSDEDRRWFGDPHGLPPMSDAERHLLGLPLTTPIAPQSSTQPPGYAQEFQTWNDLIMTAAGLPPGEQVGNVEGAANGVPISNSVLDETRIGWGQKGQGSGNKVDQVPNWPVLDGAGAQIPVRPTQPTGPFATQEFPGAPLAHGFPDIVDNYAGGATSFGLNNGATLYQLDGSLNGVGGRFEWIVDPNLGGVTHRMFVPGGTVNGIPVKP